MPYGRELDADIRFACVLLGLGDPGANTNPPAEPASQEKTMDRHYENTASIGCAEGRPATACEPKVPPVPLALGQLEEAVDQLMKARDYLEARLDSALSPPAPEKDTTSPDRSQAPSALAERIQQTVDRVGYVTRRLNALASRVTL